MVDQGESAVWKMTENNKIKPGSYYLHAYMSDTHIYFKLKEVVDITDSNDGVPESSDIYIKDKLLHINSLYEQVAKILWNHIQSLDEVEREAFVSNYGNDKQFYLAYKTQLKKFITEEVSILWKPVLKT